jgi:hypothetical protein
VSAARADGIVTIKSVESRTRSVLGEAARPCAAQSVDYAEPFPGSNS